MHWFECTTAELCRVTGQGPMRLVNRTGQWRVHGGFDALCLAYTDNKKPDYSQLSIDLSGTWMNIGGKKVDS